MNVLQERISGIEISPNEKSKRIINIKIKEEILDKLIFPFHKFDIHRELFKRTKAEYVSINCPESYKESPTYKPKTRDEPRLDGKKIQQMNTILIWTLALIALGLFIYFVPYRNIKIVQKKLDIIIEMLNKKDNQ